MNRSRFSLLARALIAHILLIMVLVTAVFTPTAVQAAPNALTDDFVITVKTDNPGSGPTQFTIPTTGGGYDYNVDCNNDGTDEVMGANGNYTCNYLVAGTYTIRIKDNIGDGTGFPRIYFNNGGDRLKLLTIQQWGTGSWDSMANAFMGSANLAGQASDAPNLANVSDMSWMFFDATAFNQNVGNWNTANVTNMSRMFRGAVTFNQNIGNWDTANVTNMEEMFNSAYAFNQNIGNWNTAKVINMRAMFYFALAFNQDLGGWNVSALTDATNMFSGARLSTPNYDALLIGWNNQTLQNNVTFNGGNSKYCAGATARANMVTTNSWTISDALTTVGCEDFVITVKTDNISSGSSGSMAFLIPTTGVGGDYNYNVDCNNDGVNEVTAVMGDYLCQYNVAGTYTIRIKDNSGAGTGFPRIHFNNGAERLKLLTIEQWGTGSWDSMANAFYGCENLAGQATDAPNLTNVTLMYQTFRDAIAFNQNIGNWNTTNVTYMNAMFRGATAFNQNIGGWNTANVTDMNQMFYDATAFNRNIGGWNTANVTRMDSMFGGAAAFNQNIGGWNTAKVINMNGMFQDAIAFNQNIGSWNVAALIDATSMFNGATLSTANYDALLIGWNNQTLQNGVTFNGGNNTYCAGEAARTNMTINDSWTISDAGSSTSCHAKWDGGGGDNNWSTAANWVGDSVPTAANIAYFDNTSSKNSVVDGAFAGTVGGVQISDVYTGTLSFTSPLAVIGAYAQDGGTVVVNSAQPLLVEGSFSHTGGVLRQTRPVGAGSVVNFLQIQTSGGSDVYRGVDLGTTIPDSGDLGNVTVAVQAVDRVTEFCTTDGVGSPAYAGRCFTISPDNNNLPARVTLWALTSETPASPVVYHFNADWQPLLNPATGTAGAYTWVSGDAPGFSAFLLGGAGAPTAVTLQSFATTSAPPMVLAGVGLALLALMSGWLLRRRAV